jgi:hypothetical protein
MRKTEVPIRAATVGERFSQLGAALLTVAALIKAAGQMDVPSAPWLVSSTSLAVKDDIYRLLGTSLLPGSAGTKVSAHLAIVSATCGRLSGS